MLIRMYQIEISKNDKLLKRFNWGGTELLTLSSKKGGGPTSPGNYAQLLRPYGEPFNYSMIIPCWFNDNTLSAILLLILIILLITLYCTTRLSSE